MGLIRCPEYQVLFVNMSYQIKMSFITEENGEKFEENDAEPGLSTSLIIDTVTRKMHGFGSDSGKQNL